MPSATAIKTLLLLLCLHLGAMAQGHHPVGFRDITLANPRPYGSPTLPALFCHPATTAGVNVPIDKSGGPYPVIVFLHGYSGLGRHYQVLGYLLAREGYVVALLNTSQFNRSALTADGDACFYALGAAHRDPTHFLNGCLDLGRMGLVGHSMGGAAAFLAAERNPGYRALLALAPEYPHQLTDQLAIPFGIVHGLGDEVLRWQDTSLRIFEGTPRYTGFKFLYLMADACTHYNLTGAIVGHKSDFRVWERTSRIITGYFRAVLGGRTEGLEEALGQTGQDDPMANRVLYKVRNPLLWTRTDTHLGSSGKLTLLAGEGPVVIFTAWGLGNMTTPLGNLQLDPLTLLPLVNATTDPRGLVNLPYTVPATIALTGVTIPFQAIGMGHNGTLRLSNYQPLNLLP